MEGQLIVIEDYCNEYHIDVAFINSLEEFGLLDLVFVEGRRAFPVSKVPAVEKYMHLYYELEINMAGIEAISHLLQRIEELQNELAATKGRLQENA